MILIDIINPIGIYILMKKFQFKNQQKYIRKILVSSVLICLIGGFGTWGHTSWTNQIFEAKFPKEMNYDQSVFVFADNSPNSWLATLMPPETRFIRINIFEDSTGERLGNLMDGKENIYTIFSASVNWREDNIKKWNHILEKFRLLSTRKNCEKIDKLIKKINFRGSIETSENTCKLKLKNSDIINLKNSDDIRIEEALKTLDLHGIKLIHSRCERFPARIGKQKLAYMLCPIKKIK